jgi:hypothetical protein
MKVREPLGIGFVGCGRIADLQCLGYREHPRARIVAICDRDEALARRRAREWEVPRVYTNLDRLLEDPEVDAVEILTPHHLHEEHARAALEAGKHVSLQKPPTHSLAGLDALDRAARSAGRVLRVFENFMYYPPHIRARQLVEEGAIGDPLSVRIKTAAGRLTDGWQVTPATQAWRLDPETCGGGPTTFDHGYHCFHMGRFFIPAEVDRVHAFIHWTRLGERAWIDGPALISWSYQGEVPRYGSWEVIASVGMRVRSRYYVSDDRLGEPLHREAARRALGGGVPGGRDPSLPRPGDGLGGVVPPGRDRLRGRPAGGPVASAGSGGGAPHPGLRPRGRPQRGAGPRGRGPGAATVATGGLRWRSTALHTCS